MASQTRLIDTLPPPKRVKPMEVLALGFSRTGTMSLKRALEQLGYSVYHMEECATRWQEKHVSLFEEATKAKLLGQGKLWTGEELDRVLQNYTALEDIPCLHFVDELLEQYPDAKVILTTRDVDSWQKSMEQSFYKILDIRILPFMVAIDPIFWRPYYFLLKSSLDKWTDGDHSNKEALRRTFVEHYAHVRSKVPKSKLLEFHPREGWTPLCTFLGKEVPKDKLFPRVNDAASTVNLHRLIVAIRLWHIFGKYLGMLAAVGVGYGLLRWSRTYH
ncbi:P-loop containing nucleoside triphosphate hydrolase protein [Lophiotrema nucula]|uniref:P-loop containing nucleoside triphosphate hydrolase protein n=1 Tax=Lophiotrema nucula TaxID=690887 RepID=A0A6A5ZLQ6_9PLEO|nr:P-loop containing nucleoside triphosphate hydrolase protein [Lophiotrema nucula]